MVESVHELDKFIVPVPFSKVIQNRRMTEILLIPMLTRSPSLKKEKMEFRLLHIVLRELARLMKTA